MQPDTAPNPPFARFPQQPVHPRLVERLFQETERLRRSPSWVTVPLPATIDLNVVAAALRGLEGRHEPKRCLDPWRHAELNALLTEGVRLVHYCWKVYAKSALFKYCQARSEGRLRPPEVSLEALVGDGWTPRVELHDGYTSGCPYRDILRGDLGQALLHYLIRERNVDEGRATVLALDLLTGDPLPYIREVVQEMGCPLPPYDTLRRWVDRERRRLRQGLRAWYIAWGIAPPDEQTAPYSPETSPEVPGDSFSYVPAWRRLSHFSAVRTFCLERTLRCQAEIARLGRE